MVKQPKTFRYFERKTKSLSKRIKLFVKHRLGWLGVPIIIPYRGFGNNEELLVNGYVTEDKGLEKPIDRNTAWQNMLPMIKRYSSDEIPGVKVKIRIDGEEQELKTEETGMFRASFQSQAAITAAHSRWIDYFAELETDLIGEHRKVMAKGEILIPGDDVDFGVISDVDDTILISYATQTLRKLRLMLFRNSRTRKPFPGVAAFYRALHQGKHGSRFNPFFYVSSSEWNLYDLLEDFCDFNGFPKGVFLLRELKVSVLKFWKSGGGDHQHKFRKIKTLFETYPDISFVLIGDNGQRDPEIYSRIALEYPNRIKVIYIRVVRNKKKDDRLKEIKEELLAKNIQIIFVSDTVEAARHAVENDLISEEKIASIVDDARIDLDQK